MITSTHIPIETAVKIITIKTKINEKLFLNYTHEDYLLYCIHTMLLNAKREVIKLYGTEALEQKYIKIPQNVMYSSHYHNRKLMNYKSTYENIHIKRKDMKKIINLIKIDLEKMYKEKNIPTKITLLDRMRWYLAKLIEKIIGNDYFLYLPKKGI
jgi:hypothetical protein